MKKNDRKEGIKFLKKMGFFIPSNPFCCLNDFICEAQTCEAQTCEAQTCEAQTCEAQTCEAQEGETNE